MFNFQIVASNKQGDADIELPGTQDKEGHGDSSLQRESEQDPDGTKKRRHGAKQDDGQPKRSSVYATEDITFEDMVTEQGTVEDDGVEGRLGFLKRKSDKARVITPNPKFL